MPKRFLFKSATCLSLLVMATSPLQAQSVDQILRGVLGANDNRDRDRNDDRRNNDRRDNGSEEAGGAGCAVGGVAGALLGKSTAGKVALGGVLCFVGWNIGKALTRRDKEKLTERSTQLLYSDGPHSETWTAPDSREQIRLTTTAASMRDQRVPFEVDEGVQSPSSGTRIEAATYTVSSRRLNFRSSPSARNDNNIIGYFDKGSRVEVLGRTPDGQWALVGDRGVLVGYAAFSENGVTLLNAPGGAPRRARAVARARPKVIRRTSNSAAPEVAVVRNAQTAQVKTVQVRASTSCKAVIAQTGNKSDSRNGCTLPNGQWAIA